MKQHNDSTRQLAALEAMELIEEALQQLAQEGRIVDSGEREWNPVTRKHDIVWVSSELATKH
ncbi:hypothetical protein CQ12_33420 [Bradyrhizobium jicamae]|uniref:Uncharacterized protein n=1 Tax=Bradyrhizobium jicamae TaxID=280332 RepID=A0A0R3LEU0_9BRAD|nr:hypothetical protein [Bradyrhizobium jicamae]KRR06356.1 hypothetical protein CQ12_33420 [Bradyrhizobium jicamae]